MSSPGEVLPKVNQITFTDEHAAYDKIEKVTIKSSRGSINYKIIVKTNEAACQPQTMGTVSEDQDEIPNAVEEDHRSLHNFLSNRYP